MRSKPSNFSAHVYGTDDSQHCATNTDKTHRHGGAVQRDNLKAFIRGMCLCSQRTTACRIDYQRAVLTIASCTTAKYEKASGCLFGNRKQQPLFACSFMARTAIKIRVDGLLLARTEKASFEEGAICPSLNILKYGTPMSYLAPSVARYGIGLPFSSFLAVADTGKWWVNLFAKHVILCDVARCF